MLAGTEVVHADQRSSSGSPEVLPRNGGTCTTLAESHSRTLIPIPQARMELRRLKWLKRAAWAVGVIKKYFLGWQVRKEVQEMRRRQREKEAVLVIQKYYRGWKVLLHFQGA